MTVTELGYFLILVEKIFGKVTIHIGAPSDTVKLKNSTGEVVGQYTISYGTLTEVWLRIDKVPEPKKKEVEKVLQTNRFDTIVNDNG